MSADSPITFTNEDVLLSHMPNDMPNSVHWTGAGVQLLWTRRPLGPKLFHFQKSLICHCLQ